MSTRIAGMGWVTPFGTGLDEVWNRVIAGERAEPVDLPSPSGAKPYRILRVPPESVAALGKKPRLRRSSAITYFTAAAGLAALENAGIEMSPSTAESTALVFAVTDGGVIYTRKFYETIVTQGANVASPLLFPETVYNAPASHLAAVLGITGMTYTLVGDATVGIAALDFAGQLLDTTPTLDRVLVVGGEELDWVLCEAYRAWRLGGAMLAEGAAALLLDRTAPLKIARIQGGVPFFRRSEAAGALATVCRMLSPADAVVGSANGTFVDTIEAAALEEFFPRAAIHRPKAALGEAVGAGALMQTIGAALEAWKTGRPVAVTCLGFNQQAAGALIAEN